MTTLLLHRSKVANINLVPHNILAVIFRMAGQDTQPGHTHAAISIWQTCREWRKVAEMTMSSQMWTNLDLRFVERAWWVDFLERGRGCWVEVTTALRQKTQRDFCRRNIADIRRLEVIGITHEMDSYRVWNVPAPRLEDLTLRSDAGVCLSSLFQAQTPKLKSLTLEQVCIQRKDFLGIYHSLVSISLTIPPGKCTKIPHDPLPVLDILRKSSNLEVFRLRSRDRELNISSSKPVKPIVLFKLRVLDITVQLPDVNRILSSVQMPSKGELRAEAVPSKGLTVESRVIKLPRDPRCLPCLNCLESLSVDYARSEIRGDTGDMVVSLSYSSGSNPKHARQVMMSTTAILQQNYRLHDLKRVEISGYSAEEDISVFLQHAPSVTEVKITCCSSVIFESVRARQSATAFWHILEVVTVESLKISLPVLEAFFESLTKNRKLKRIRLDNITLDNVPLESERSKVLDEIKKTCEKPVVGVVRYTHGGGAYQFAT